MLSRILRVRGSLGPRGRTRLFSSVSVRQCANGDGHDHGHDNSKPEAPDHRKLATAQSLFTTSPYSPGSPLFLPAGTWIFNKLVSFLRNQYRYYGFEEVLTPVIYKKDLWELSGHWAKYRGDMFSVTGMKGEEEGEEMGLKPMNCPGHCLLFKSQARSYRELPVRYADFSPLHRNEITGALSGLTRVRRFHQDDGHIFCRPSQVKEEIQATLSFVRVVYSVLKLGSGYTLALSTRPESYIGTLEEWDRAEKALREALEDSGMPFIIKQGDGAFYGPKIDIIVTDNEGKSHQTATVQLDFQLPKRFELSYTSPSPTQETLGLPHNPEEPSGPVTPVMIHRAVLGSVERLMALLIEQTDGKWPFWLNPQPAVIATVNDSPELLEYAKKVQDVIEGHDREARETLEKSGVVGRFRVATGLKVDIDGRPLGIGKKNVEARKKGVGLFIVVGPKDLDDGTVTVNGPSLPEKYTTLDAKGRKAPARVTPEELRDLMRELSDTFQ